MKLKIAPICLALVAMVFVFSGNAWAGRDHHPGQRYDKGYRHHGAYGGQPHRGHYDRGRHVKRFYPAPRHGFRHHGSYRRPIIKHYYYHDGGHRYSRHHRNPGVFFSFGIGGHR